MGKGSVPGRGHKKTKKMWEREEGEAERERERGRGKRERERERERPLTSALLVQPFSSWGPGHYWLLISPSPGRAD